MVVYMKVTKPHQTRQSINQSVRHENKEKSLTAVPRDINVRNPQRKANHVLLYKEWTNKREITAFDSCHMSDKGHDNNNLTQP